jgi:hypothetical protein
MNKERIKGIIIGIIICVMISAGIMVVAANTETVSRNITYGINVMLNGEIINFSEDGRPFTMGGRTFLPLRALAELLDLPVDFDPATNTVILGRAEARPGIPVSELFFDWSSFVDGHARNQLVEIGDSVMMGGNSYNDVVIFSGRGGANIGWRATRFTQSSMLNLNARYQWLNLNFGRVDGSGTVDATVNIYFDDRLIESFEQSAQSLPKELRLFAEGVRGVRIEVITYIPNNVTMTYAVAGFAE